MSDAPNAKRGPGQGPATAALRTLSSDDPNDSRTVWRGPSRLRLPTSLEERLAVLEAEVARLSTCVMACAGVSCPSRCHTVEVMSR